MYDVYEDGKVQKVTAHETRSDNVPSARLATAAKQSIGV